MRCRRLHWSYRSASPRRNHLIEIVKVETGFTSRLYDPHISLTLLEKSARLLAEITQANIGRPLHLLVDGKIVMSPVIREPILKGQVQISGGFTAGGTDDMAKSIRADSKVEVEVVIQ